MVAWSEVAYQVPHNDDDNDERMNSQCQRAWRHIYAKYSPTCSLASSNVPAEEGTKAAHEETMHISQGEVAEAPVEPGLSHVNAEDDASDECHPVLEDPYVTAKGDHESKPDKISTTSLEYW